MKITRRGRGGTARLVAQAPGRGGTARLVAQAPPMPGIPPRGPAGVSPPPPPAITPSGQGLSEIARQSELTYLRLMKMPAGRAELLEELRRSEAARGQLELRAAILTRQVAEQYEELRTARLLAEDLRAAHRYCPEARPEGWR